MAKYSHTFFTAADRRAFRAALVNAIRADLAISQTDGLLGEEDRCDGGIVLRRTLKANGRTIGYDALIKDDGAIAVRDLVSLDRGYGMIRHKTYPVQFDVEANRFSKMWMAATNG